MALQQGATDAFKTGLMNGGYNFTSGSFKMALYTGSATLGPSTAVYTSTNEVVATGYTAGGIALPVSVAPTSSNNITYISFSNVTWYGSITARGALIYKDLGGGSTASVCVLDFGSDKTSVNTFVVQFPSSTYSTAILRIV